MHEYSIVGALVEDVAAEMRARGATAVRGVTIRIGELSGVDIDLLRTAFVTFAPKTVCEHAELTIETVPAVWTCRHCGRPIAPNAVLSCPACHAPARLGAGDEIVLERIELEVPDV